MKIEFWSKGVESYRFLSNFHPCSLVYKGKQFLTAEHAYHWDKLENKDDFNHLELLSPSEVKKQIKNFVCKRNWDDLKIQSMREITLEKYNQNPALRKELMRLYLSGAVFIHEVPWKDTFWGSYKGEGLNMQGALLAEYAFSLLKEKVSCPQRVLNNQKSKAVFIGRPSKWGNPFVLTDTKNIQDRYSVIKEFSAYLAKNDDLLTDLAEIENKNVSCFCAPLACHGDILLCAQWLLQNRGLESCKQWLTAFSIQGYSWDCAELQKVQQPVQDTLF